MRRWKAEDEPCALRIALLERVSRADSQHSFECERIYNSQLSYCSSVVHAFVLFGLLGGSKKRRRSATAEWLSLNRLGDLGPNVRREGAGVGEILSAGTKTVCRCVFLKLPLGWGEGRGKS